MQKALKIAINVFVGIIVAFAVISVIFTVITLNTVNSRDRTFFNYRMYIVTSDSMSSVEGDTKKGYFSAGDLIFVKPTDPKKLEKGDIITFESKDTDSFGAIITHKIKDTAITEDNELGFITYGTATGQADREIVTYSNILGKYSFRIKNLGSVFIFLKKPIGFILCIVLPMLAIIVFQAINVFRILQKYKQEQNSTDDNEHQRLLEEVQRLKHEQEMMLKELQRLRQQQEEQ